MLVTQKNTVLRTYIHTLTICILTYTQIVCVKIGPPLRKALSPQHALPLQDTVMQSGQKTAASLTCHTP